MDEHIEHVIVGMHYGRRPDFWNVSFQPLARFSHPRDFSAAVAGKLTAPAADLAFVEAVGLAEVSETSSPPIHFVKLGERIHQSESKLGTVGRGFGEICQLRPVRDDAVNLFHHIKHAAQHFFVFAQGHRLGMWGIGAFKCSENAELSAHPVIGTLYRDFRWSSQHPAMLADAQTKHHIGIPAS